ncbi:PEPxxWA-CTERM sorting domain-containing protein [Thermaurantiacus sp.]
MKSRSLAVATVATSILGLSPLAEAPAEAVTICVTVKGGTYYVRARIRVKSLFGHIQIDPVSDIYLYSPDGPVDPLGTTLVQGSPGIGSWASQVVNTDSAANPLTHLGMRFFLTAGDGVSPDETAVYNFFATGPITTLVADYYDSATGIWTRGVICPTCSQPVPEPDSWLLMIAGFGLVGLAIRRFRPRPGPNAHRQVVLA